MLRRKPTALTVTTDDLAAFETSHAHRLAYLKFRRTGEDPRGLFSTTTGMTNPNMAATQRRKAAAAAAAAVDAGGGGTDSRGTTADPNDELKPLPGDRARIVRGREERILGTAAAAAAAGGAGQRGSGSEAANGGVGGRR